MAALAGMTRETRLLAATIAVSVLVLFVLAQFRFPADAEIRSDPVQTQPLARLAARAAFDDLSSAIGQLSTRVGPSLVVLRLSMPPAADADARLPRPTRYVPALRIRDDTAIVMLPRGARVEGVATLPGPVSVVGHDPVRELALVRIPPEPAQVLTVREGSTPLTAPGYVAVAEATSGGLALRPLFLGRSDMQADPRWDSALLTIGRGAAGDAGAPVFTLDGRLAGIVVLTDGDPVLIPGDLVMASADQMFRGTVVTSGDIGLTVQPLDARAARAAGTSSGALVAYVSPDGPSHEALWVGDVVTAVNGQPVGNADGLRLRVSRTAPGVQLTLTVLRNGSAETVPVVVRARPATVAAPDGGAPPTATADLGLTLRAVPNTGAEVVRVRPDSAAALAGLRPADLIMSVARIRTPEPAEVAEAWDAMPPGGSMFLGVERAGQAMAVVLER
jgi:serine protease Do